VNERVLVIDDDPTSTAVISAVLEAAGYRVTALSSPIGATRAARDNEIRVVVCDLNMPAMRGDAFARMFRSSPVLRSLRLVIVSAAPPAELERLMTEGTVDGVVHKGELDRALVPLLKRLGH
jgi:CheY-like chemotaxis protein